MIPAGWTFTTHGYYNLRSTSLNVSLVAVNFTYGAERGYKLHIQKSSHLWRSSFGIVWGIPPHLAVISPSLCSASTQRKRQVCSLWRWKLQRYLSTPSLQHSSSFKKTVGRAFLLVLLSTWGPVSQLLRMSVRLTFPAGGVDTRDEKNPLGLKGVCAKPLQ